MRKKTEMNKLDRKEINNIISDIAEFRRDGHILSTVIGIIAILSGLLLAIGFSYGFYLSLIVLILAIVAFINAMITLRYACLKLIILRVKENKTIEFNNGEKDR